MKYIVPAFLFCFVSFSQTKASIFSNEKKTYAFTYKLDSLSNLKPNLNYHFKIADANLLSVYNCNTKQNNEYIFSNNSVYFLKSVNANANESIPKDSFNPSGLNDIRAKLINGLSNTIFNSFKFKL